MPRGIMVMAYLLGSAWVATGDEKDQDPVKEKLFAAKVAYDAEMRLYRKLAGEWFDKRDEDARKDGNKKLVDQIKGERKAFDETGELPRAAPAGVLQKPALAQKALEAAFDQAVKDSIKVKKDDQAAVIEAEWKAFRTKEPTIKLRPAIVTTKDDLQKYLSGTSWGAGMKLKADGYVENKGWEDRGLVTKWQAVDRRTVVLWVEKGRNENRYAILIFSEELTEYGGYDFNGQDKIPSSKRKP